MTDIAKALGAQSYCYRGFKKNEEVIAGLKKSGLTTTELCGVHFDFNQDKGADEVIRLYRDNGIAIVSIGVQRMANQPDVERKYFEFCKRCGAKALSVDFPMDTIPQSFRAAEKLADEYNVRLGIHNHGGGHWLGSSTALRWVFKQTSPRIGLCLDTAWAIDARQDPIKMADEFKDRLVGLHIKDFTYQPNHKPVDVIAGSGILNLKGLIAKLREVKFGGFAVLEYEGDVENPVPALTRCTEAVRAACQ